MTLPIAEAIPEPGSIYAVKADERDVLDAAWLASLLGDARLLGFDNVRVLAHDGPMPSFELRLKTSAGREEIATTVSTRMRSSTSPNDLPAPVEGLFSVVVCTRDRAETLATCLTGLRTVVDHDAEIIVVDNAPTSPDTRRTVERAAELDPRIRYVMEPAAGLSRARNRGMREARANYIAFTDDDALVDGFWLEGLRRGFNRAEDVGLVTGMVRSASMLTAAQIHFDARMPWGASLEPAAHRLRDRDQFDVLFPYQAGRFGTGASFAVRRDAYDSVDGFDNRLGAGTRSRGGEDLDLFTRVILDGWTLVYEPTSLVWHTHRGGRLQLQQQMFGYGCGLFAYVTKLLVSRDTRADVVKRIWPAAKWFVEGRLSEDEAGHSRNLLLREVAGMLYGPFALLSEHLRRR